MWSRRILVLIIGLLAGLFDVTVAPWLPGGLSAMRAVLPLVIISAAFSSWERCLTVAIAAGLVMDVLQPSFGLVTLRLLLVASAIRILSQTYLTNRSATGSVALGILGLVVDRILLAMVTLMRDWVGGLFIPEVHPPFLAEAIWMTVCMGGVFVMFAAFTKRFMPLLTRRS